MCSAIYTSPAVEQINVDVTPGSSRSHIRLLSVIIPVCNAAALLGRQLAALRDQEYSGGWEIIVVNNRSTDATVRVVQAFQKTMPNLRLVDAPAMRKRAYAYNTGAKAARGDAFIFCDADDIVAQGWLSTLARALEKYDFVAGALDLDTLNQSAPRRPPPTTGAKYPTLDFMPYAITCNMGVSRNAFEAVGGFSDMFAGGGDVDLSWRLQLQGYPIHDVPEAIVHYRYRKTLWGVYKQFLRIGFFQPLIYRRFASYGMPRASTKKALQQYRRLAKRRKIFRLLLGRMEQRELENWVWQVGIRLGRLLGSVRYRTIYL